MTQAIYSPDHLIGCHTVIEAGSEGSSPGSLAYLEGDIMEIRNTQLEGCEVGRRLKVVIEAAEDQLAFQTTVLARFREAVIVLVPDNLHQRIIDSRLFMRIPTAIKGYVHAVYDYGLIETVQYANPLEIDISNIGQGGLGFRFTKALPTLPGQSQIMFEMKLDRVVLCNAVIKHQTEQADGWYYGAEFVHMSDNHKMALRSYIMKQQILLRMDMHRGMAGNS